MRTTLTADTTFYVDPNKGIDTNAGTNDAPWKTIQGAIKVLQTSYDLGGYQATISLAKGVYTAGARLEGRLVGQSSELQIIGSGTSPKFDDCVVLPTSNNCFAFAFNAWVLLAGMLLDGSSSPGWDLLGIGQGAMVYIGKGGTSASSDPPQMCFGPCDNPGNHIAVAFGRAGFQVLNNYAIWCAGHQPQCHIDADDAWCYFNTNGQPGLLIVSILDDTGFVDSFVHCSNSDLNIQAVGWYCIGAALQGTTTCIVEKGGIIDTASNGNPNYFPGTIAPVIRLGWGLYL